MLNLQEYTLTVFNSKGSPGFINPHDTVELSESWHKEQTDDCIIFYDAEHMFVRQQGCNYYIGIDLSTILEKIHAGTGREQEQTRLEQATNLDPIGSTHGSVHRMHPHL